MTKKLIYTFAILLLAGGLDASPVFTSLARDDQPVDVAWRAGVDLSLPPLAEGMEEDRISSVLRDDKSGHWLSGLADYRKHDMISAALHFRALLSRKDLPPSDRAACAFWTYRAILAAGGKQLAMQYAKRAAEEPLSFYSILARNVVGGNAVEGSAEINDGHYPVPHWKPSSGYHVEPALLFAIMRQESGFNPHARSAAGALGVMQLMPATAHAMAKNTRVVGRSGEPSVSMTLGQSYLEHLMNISFIGNNLVYLTAAYNAGPGSVDNWQRNLHYSDDPLLFVESIPYGETRDYVQHVIGNYWVYSELLGGYEPASATALSRGEWPQYDDSGEQLALMLSRLNKAD